jgi:magnesium transporter
MRGHCISMIIAAHIVSFILGLVLLVVFFRSVIALTLVTGHRYEPIAELTPITRERALAYFEHEIEKAVVLALFIPLIISGGGNAGSQACSLIIRAMALGEVGLRQWWRVLRREITSGLLLGALLGVIAMLRIVLWPTRQILYGEHYMLIAFTVSASVIGVVTFGTIAGSMLPFILRRLGFDPATASAPFVATLVDVTGIVIYFSVAAVVMRGTLL